MNPEELMALKRVCSQIIQTEDPMERARLFDETFIDVFGMPRTIILLANIIESLRSQLTMQTQLNLEGIVEE